MLFSVVATPLRIPTQSVGGFHFPCVLCSTSSWDIILMMDILADGRRFLSVDLISIYLIMSGSSLVWLSIKESACNVGDVRDSGLIPELGRSPGEGNGNLLQYSFLEDSMTEETGMLEATGS